LTTEEKRSRTYNRKQFNTHQTRTCTGTSRNRTQVHPHLPEEMAHKNLQGQKMESKSRIGSRPIVKLK
jgi:hypothetical protein